MEDRVQKFYDTMYGLQMTQPKEGFLFSHLKKFEDYREGVVYRLLSSGKKLLDVGCGDGALIVEVPNIAYLPQRVKLLFGILPVTSKQVGWDGGTLHYFTMSSLCKLIEGGELKVVQKTGSGIFASLRNWWASLLTGDLIVKGIKL